nr:hypothetical protein [Tanacetum cinerariifolium]
MIFRPTMFRRVMLIECGQDNAFDDDVDEQPVNVDNVFQADDCDAFDSDVDEAPTAQTMFMANLSSADPVTDEAGPSYDSDILSEVPDHEHYQDAACAHHEGHVTYDSVQLDHVVDSHADYTSDSVNLEKSNKNVTDLQISRSYQLNMQTQTSNSLHNAIMEAGSKDRPPMLAPGNYIQWKSRIKQAVATACYTQNRSLIHTRHHKTPYELVHNKKHDLTFFRVFGALCYPTNDSEDLGKLQPTADNGIFVGYAPSRKGYRIYNKRTRRIMETIHVQFDELTELMAPMHLSTGPTPTFLTPGQISSGLVPNLIPATPYAPPTNKELDILFQPMFDEYLEPPRAERLDSPAQAVQVLVSSAGTPLSTTIDQDVPSPHISPSSSALQSHSLPPGIIAEPYFMEDHTVAPVGTNPFVNVFAPEPHSEASSSGDISSTESPYVS